MYTSKDTYNSFKKNERKVNFKKQLELNLYDKKKATDKSYKSISHISSSYSYYNNKKEDLVNTFNYVPLKYKQSYNSNLNFDYLKKRKSTSQFLNENLFELPEIKEENILRNNKDMYFGPITKGITLKDFNINNPNEYFPINIDKVARRDYDKELFNFHYEKDRIYEYIKNPYTAVVNRAIKINDNKSLFGFKAQAYYQEAFKLSNFPDKAKMDSNNPIYLISVNPKVYKMNKWVDNN